MVELLLKKCCIMGVCPEKSPSFLVFSIFIECLCLSAPAASPRVPRVSVHPDGKKPARSSFPGHRQSVSGDRAESGRKSRCDRGFQNQASPARAAFADAAMALEMKKVLDQDPARALRLDGIPMARPDGRLPGWQPNPEAPGRKADFITDEA